MKIDHFSVKNGFIDLRTGELVPLQREDYITCHIVYDPEDADLAAWTQFITDLYPQ